MRSLNKYVLSTYYVFSTLTTPGNVSSTKMYLCWLHATPFKKSQHASQQAEGVGSRQGLTLPDGLSPSGSVSSVCIAGRRGRDAAPDGEGGTLFPRTAKCKWN